eukprot:Clim_evm7s91 gene=Clim_evmTU7s91
MKTFFTIALGALVGMASASPVNVNDDTCQELGETCTTGSECCDFQGCNTVLRICFGSTDVDLRRINAPCDGDDNCHSSNCQNNYCAPPDSAKPDGETCIYDLECIGGWCDASEEGPAKCNDRRLHPTDPPKWIAVGTPVGMASATPVVVNDETCQEIGQTCSTGAECCDFHGCNMDSRQCEGTGLGFRRINAPCDDDSMCWSQNCQNSYCAPNSSGKADGENCTYDMDCAGGWCDGTEEGHAKCNDRRLHPTDKPNW